MKITGIDIRKYSLTLKKPLALKGLHIDCRRGAFIFLETSDRVVGVGEIAVLAGLHQETLDEAITNMLQIEENIVGLDISDVTAFDSCLFPQNILPSVRLAIEIAMMHVLLQQGGFDDIQTPSMPLNGLLTAGVDDIIKEVDNLIADGHLSIKIKVARQSIERDIDLIQKVIQRLPDNVTLRLDANRSWTLDAALAFSNGININRVEYIEEPLADVGDYPAFFDQTDIRIALDESLVGCSPESIPYIDNIEAMILKPSLLGGLEKTEEFVKFAHINSIKPVVSCTFQTDFTISIFALFAARLGIVDVPLGLDISKFYAENILVRPLRIANGRIDLEDLLSHRLELKMDRLTCCH